MDLNWPKSTCFVRKNRKHSKDIVLLFRWYLLISRGRKMVISLSHEARELLKTLKKIWLSWINILKDLKSILFFMIVGSIHKLRPHLGSSICHVGSFHSNLNIVCFQHKYCMFSTKVVWPCWEHIIRVGLRTSSANSLIKRQF